MIRDLKPGDTVRLNGRAREWFSGKTAVVDEIREWGVVCHVEMVDGSITPYRAGWDEIDWFD